VTKRTRQYLLAVVPGDTHVDLARLTRMAGGTKAGFAVREVAEELTGTTSGSFPPFSFHPDLELVVDPSLLVHEEIFFNAARLDQSVALRTSDYLTMANPRIEPITRRAADVPPTPRTALDELAAAS
jgi:Ala-tRNA(Pro) deacylase